MVSTEQLLVTCDVNTSTFIVNENIGSSDIKFGGKYLNVSTGTCSTSDDSDTDSITSTGDNTSLLHNKYGNKDLYDDDDDDDNHEACRSSASSASSNANKNDCDSDSDDDEDEDGIPKPVLDELRILVSLAIPSTISQLSWSVPSGFVASYIGIHFGSLYLDAYSLATTICGLCTLSLLEGVYDAMDTLMPQAYGYKKYKSLQIIAIRGVAMCFAILLPFILLLATSMDRILQYTGQDAEVSALAQEWFCIYCISLPFYALFNTASIFLSSQNKLMPEVYAVLVSVVVVFPAALHVFARNSAMGFHGTAVAMAITEIFQALFLWWYMRYTKCYHPKTWITGNFSNIRRRRGCCKSLLPVSQVQSAVCKWKSVKGFVWLSFGGMLVSSEWIYWEIISVLIGTRGKLALSIHTIPTQVATVLYTIFIGCGIALSIRIGNVLPVNPSSAKRICYIGCGVSIILFGLITLLTYLGRDILIRLFTTEAAIIEGCHKIWGHVSLYIFNLGLYALNCSVATSLGQQWSFGIYTIVILFGIGLPLFYYNVVLKRSSYQQIEELEEQQELDNEHIYDSVIVAWNSIVPPNLMLNVIYAIVLLSQSDWNTIAEIVREREDAEEQSCKELIAEDFDDDALESLSTSSLSRESSSNSEQNKY